MKIAVVLGTRPEIIKLAPVIKELKARKKKFFVIHTNQHYSDYMDAVFFRELNLEKPEYNLLVGSASHGKQTARIIERVEAVLQKEKPKIVLVEGDTNTVLAGAIAATKLGIPVGHVEAGLRSFDRSMPEETNRVLADHISDILFAPTSIALKNLVKEGISRKKIFITGNTIVDAINQNKNVSDRRMLERFSLKPKEFFLATFHRQENVDSKKRLSGILKGLNLVGKHFGQKIVCTLHPRTKKMLKKFSLKIPKDVQAITPPGYFDFLDLEQNARVILTDSGGVQEEACILKIPCITLRNNTERPETLIAGANVLSGTDPKEILHNTKKMVLKKSNWNNPFGKNAGKKIVKLVLTKIR